MTADALRPWLPFLGAVALLIPAACARQGAPPGGPPDRLPPVVISTRPDTFAELDAIDDAVRVRFSERISEQPTQGQLDDAVIVSPAFGEVRVDPAGDAIEIDMASGFRPGYVYRITVLPRIRDMFGNALEEPFEFVFSTGGTFHPGVSAGLVLDRITGEPVEGTRVELRPRDTTETPDDLVYVTRTDTSGIYTFRFLPPGAYDLLAYTDRDRDAEPDPFEVQGRGSVGIQGTDTLFTDVVILTPDTTAARVARATVEDSTLVRLAFDDHLDPEQDFGAVAVELVRDSVTPDTAPPPPTVVRVFHPEAFREWRDSVAEAQAVADSLAAVARADSATAADSLAADSAGAPPPERGRGGQVAGDRRAGRQQGGRPGAGQQAQAARVFLEGPLPSQEVVLLVDSAIPPDVPYRVRVGEVRNVNGLVGTAGSVEVVREAPEAPEMPMPTDTTGAAADTTGAAAGAQPADSLPPDSVPADSVPPDSVSTQPDTAGLPVDTVRPDSAAASPDSVAPDSIPPDTTRLLPFLPARRR